MNTLPSLTYYVSTPIYYVNGSPHIGHAYTSVAADVLARWKRRMGYDVFFLTGTDEHGQKVEQAAKNAGLDVQAYTDQMSAQFSRMGEALGLSNDYFIRTTDEQHKSFCQEIWADLEKKGFIYLGVYAGWYATRDECYYNDSEVSHSPTGKSVAIETGSEVTWVEEPSCFFRLTFFVDRVRKHIIDNPDFILPLSSRNEVLALLDTAEDVCISRTSFSWGIPVPNRDSHVMYVWVDALMNYITALGISDKMDFWPADVHLIGKEITRFHVIIWPALLMALNYSLPKKIFAHGWWTANGRKMGKSVGNVIDPINAVETFGLDKLRYFLLREMPFGNDGDFSHESLVRRTNAELANDLGNLAQRTLSMIAKCESVPRIWIEKADDTALLLSAKHLENIVGLAMDRLAFHEALEAVWKVVRDANAYISAQAPWKKDLSPERVETVLRVLLDVLKIVSSILTPFMPESMTALTAQLENPLAPPVPIFPRA